MEPDPSLAFHRAVNLCVIHVSFLRQAARHNSHACSVKKVEHSVVHSTGPDPKLVNAIPERRRMWPAQIVPMDLEQSYSLADLCGGSQIAIPEVANPIEDGHTPSGIPVEHDRGRWQAPPNVHGAGRPRQYQYCDVIGLVTAVPCANGHDRPGQAGTATKLTHLPSLCCAARSASRVSRGLADGTGAEGESHVVSAPIGSRSRSDLCNNGG
jgi:hypothetical protein